MLLAGAAILLSSSGVDAAIAPEYRRVNQFGAALSLGSTAAAKLAPHGLIDRIEAVDGTIFRFWAKQCFVPVTLTVEPDEPGAANRAPVVGAPTRYRAAIGDVHCN
jgi:hypothetical protein